MRWYVLMLFSSLGFSIICDAQLKTYAIDTSASKVEFNVSHLGVLNVNGTFQDFEGKVAFTNNTLSALQARIRVKSIFTNDASRDETLVSKSYFNAIAYPTIQFESENIKLASEEIFGSLTIKKVTKPIVLSLQWSETKQEIRLTAQISRKNFNLKFGSMNGLIGDIVEIDVLVKY